MGLFSRKKDNGNSQEKEQKTEKSAQIVIKEKKEEKKSSMKELYQDKSKTAVAEKVINEKKKDDEIVKTEKKARKYGNAYRILIKPLVTEKASTIGLENKYIFTVSQSANKIEIAKAVNEVYGVKPVSINIIRIRGKNVRFGRTRGRRKDWKKAIITLPEGKSIKIYEGV